MTSNELGNYLNKEYGIENPWPAKLEVDADTYAQVCQAIFDHVVNNYHLSGPFYEIALGPNKGIMFKNVELILKERPE